MDGTIRDDQIRFAVTRDERIAWREGLQRRSLNGSALLRQFMDEQIDKWNAEEDAQSGAAT